MQRKNKDIQCVWRGMRPDINDWDSIYKDHQRWIHENHKGLPPHNLSKAFLDGANLRGCNLGGADFSEAFLTNSDLSNAVLDRTLFTGATLSLANFTGSNLFRADFSNADLSWAIMEDTMLNFADFTGADLAAADFKDAHVGGVKFKRLKTCRAIRADSCYGSPRFRRYVMDQDFIEEFRKTKWGWIYWPWLVSSNCGRSLSLWFGWAIFFALCFAGVFYWLGKDAFNVADRLDFDFLTTAYYSVVTFTTLGFGDITPVSIAARWWVMAEVVLGYLMLGGLISIFANKFARRAG